MSKQSHASIQTVSLCAKLLSMLVAMYCSCTEMHTCMQVESMRAQSNIYIYLYTIYIHLYVCVYTDIYIDMYLYIYLHIRLQISVLCPPTYVPVGTDLHSGALGLDDFRYPHPESRVDPMTF